MQARRNLSKFSQAVDKNCRLDAFALKIATHCPQALGGLLLHGIDCIGKRSLVVVVASSVVVFEAQHGGGSAPSLEPLASRGAQRLSLVSSAWKRCPRFEGTHFSMEPRYEIGEREVWSRTPSKTSCFDWQLADPPLKTSISQAIYWHSQHSFIT